MVPISGYHSFKVLEYAAEPGVVNNALLFTLLQTSQQLQELYEVVEKQEASASGTLRISNLVGE